MIYNRIFKPTIQRPLNKNIFGFDVETYSRKNKFYCGSVYSENYIKTLFSKEDFIKEFKKPIYKHSFIAASNLQFDFNSIFYGSEEISNFMLMWRGSNMIFAKTHSDGKKFYRNNDDRKKTKIVTFIDTMNYASLSVKQLGDILGIHKLKKPDFLGNIPENEKEKQELIRYNIQDSRISYEAVKFLFSSFSRLGATPKLTIASTSMSLFKNKYLKDTYYRHDVDKLLEEFKAYYGGRCEAFRRGAIRNMYYYDVNSLYPYVMLNEYPNPNTLRICYKNELSYIKTFEGISYVDVYCPYMKYPLLPYKQQMDNAYKLLFPIGNFSGWYSHIELRKAIELGYLIKKVHKTYYFKETCRPFYDYVIDLYDKRNEYKKQDNPMQMVIKILLNSLYGKFGQKFIDRDNWITAPKSLEELYKIPYTEMIGNYIRIVKKFTEPRNFCIPIWALYVTAYGRIKLYELLKQNNASYVDTDSIITEQKLIESSELGKLKEEMRIKYGIIVKPKFYGLVDSEDNEHVKIKGMGVKMGFDEFTEFLKNPKKKYDKFVKFKESLRRGLIPNEIIEITKNMKLEDNKRYWNKTFSFNELQESEPLKIGLQGILAVNASLELD